MKIAADKLANQLSTKLAPVYLIAGDETLLVQEALQLLRTTVQKAGFAERKCLSSERGFDWEELLFESRSQSLFSQRKVIELRLSSTKIGDVGSRAIQRYMANLAEDTILIIICGKLESAQWRSKWVKVIDQSGVLVQVWPIDHSRLPQWINHRGQRLGLEFSRPALDLLVDRVEGNLLAAVQELEKLWLINGEGFIDEEGIKDLVGDSARFNIYVLVDYCLAGKVERAVHALEGLRAEGVEAILVLWALTREIRSMSTISGKVTEGENIEQVFNQLRVWERRKPMVRTALQRHALKSWMAMLGECGQIDLTIKGLLKDNPWDRLLRLCSDLCGRKLFSPSLV